MSVAEKMAADNIVAKLTRARVVPVLTLERIDDALLLAALLLEAGVTAVEVALRTPVAMEILRAMKQAQPALTIGAGTVLSPAQADTAQGAGADFALAPGFDLATAKHCRGVGLPFIPGVSTASDIQAAVALDIHLLKWFPAEPLGGIQSLRTLAAPFRHLGVKYLPLGGITMESAKTYLMEADVAAVGGSWIAPNTLIDQKAWANIRSRAVAAVEMAKAQLKF